MSIEVKDLQYPIGKFKFNEKFSEEIKNNYIREIEELPALLRKEVEHLSEEQLNTPYRPGGWTVKQVVHHIPDSHINSYVRFKLALTEENPLIKPYEQAQWAELEDSSVTPVSVSLLLLENLHKRWVILLKSLTLKDCERTLQHPEIGSVNLKWMLAQYAWHGKHHLAHITSLKKRMDW